MGGEKHSVRHESEAIRNFFSHKPKESAEGVDGKHSMKAAFDLLYSSKWVHHSFTKEHDVQVLKYNDPTMGGSKKELIFKASVTLTAHMGELRSYSLGYTDRSDGDSSKDIREVVEQIDRYTRILYRRLAFPPPFKARDIVFFDVLRDFDGGTSFITYGTPTTHTLKPEGCCGDGTVRLNNYLYLQHFEETADSTASAPQCRYTYIYKNRLDLFGVPSSVLVQMIVNNMVKKVDLLVALYGKADEQAANEKFNALLEKINVRHTLGRLFRGNKIFLVLVSLR